MTIDLNTYSVNKEFIQKWYLKNNHKSISYTVSMLACFTFCPCIVVAFYIGEISNWPKEVTDCIDRLTKFYGYVILNKPSSYPEVK